MTADLSLTLEEGMPGFPGYPGYQARQLERHEVEGKVSHHLTMNSHQGTHVDAPAHFIEGGATVDDLETDLLWGEARVLDLRPHAGEELDADILERAATDLDADRVLLLTGDVDEHFGDGDFFEEAAVLTDSAAGWLLDRGVELVANDFLTESIDVPMRPVHETLLGAGVPIVEYLCNTHTIADRETVEFACFPLKLDGVEAAPARAMARL